MKAFFKNEWAKFRAMSASEKRWYIWTYYKLQIFGFIFVAFIVGSLLNAWIFNPPKQDYLYIAWIGIPAPQARLENLGEALSVIVENPERQAVHVSNFSRTDNPQFDIGVQSRFVAMLTGGLIDIILTTRDGVYEASDEGLLRPVHEVMEALAGRNPSLHAELMPTLFYEYFSPDLDAPPIRDALAVPLAGSAFLDSLGIDSNILYLCVIGNTRRFDEIAKALEVFFGG